MAVPKNILVCTLGYSWGVVPEALAFLAPGLLDLYRNHDSAPCIENARRGLGPPDEVWLIATVQPDGTPASSLLSVEDWWASLLSPPRLRGWLAEDVTQLATAAECASMSELTLRVVMHASERTQGGQLVLSLAGGRKTMGADLQRAGQIFGCTALIHIVGTEPVDERIRSATRETFRKPLPRDLANTLTPVVVGSAPRSEFVDVARPDSPHLTAASFPLPQSPTDRWCPARWRLDPGRSLRAEIESRERESSSILGNYLEHICLELCPSSNREVVGFRDPAVPDSAPCPEYPLGRLLELGLAVAICTDNPGISRTTSVDELLTASRMSSGGLTQWQALGLTRQAFLHSFLPAAIREELLKRADAHVYRVNSSGA